MYRWEQVPRYGMWLQSPRWLIPKVALPQRHTTSNSGRFPQVSIRSSSSFLSPASVCFSGLWSSQGLCLSRPGCFGALCLFLSGSLSCLLDLLHGSGPLVLASWSWSPGSGSLVLVPWFWPLVLVLQFWSPGSSGPGFIVLCNM